MRNEEMEPELGRQDRWAGSLTCKLTHLIFCSIKKLSAQLAEKATKDVRLWEKGMAKSPSISSEVTVIALTVTSSKSAPDCGK